MKNKHLILSVLLCGIALSSMAQEKTTINGYEIRGQLRGHYDGTKVYLVEEDGLNGNQTKIDSCIVKENKYFFKGGHVKYPTIHYILSDDTTSTSRYTPFFLEDGIINISSDAKYLLNADCRGTVNNEIYSFYTFMNRYITDSLIRAATIGWMIEGRDDMEKENAAFKERSATHNRRALENQYHLVNKFKNQAFAPFMIIFEMRNDVKEDELKRLRSIIDTSLNEHPYTKQLDEIIRLNEFKVGSPAPNFTMKDANGKEFELKEFRGKYVFLDFWASWCGPCVRELPNVVKLYKTCAGKNLEIIGISLDNKKEAWTEAVKKNKMEWLQLSDLKGWQTQVAEMYNIRSIPFTILIDPDGFVCGLKLRGTDLTEKVKAIMNKKQAK